MEQPDAALDTFITLIIPVTNKSSPIKEITVKTVKSPWIDEELNICIVERDEVKGMANKSGSPTDWQMYCELRNNVTKLNKNKLHYETKRNYIKNDSNKLWSTLNKIMRKKANSAPSYIESDVSFITKPTDIAKINKLRDDMPATNADTTHPSISDQIMKDKKCTFEFRKVGKKIVVFQQ